MLLGGKLHLKKHVLHLMFLQACKWAKQEEEDFFFLIHNGYKRCAMTLFFQILYIENLFEGKITTTKVLLQEHAQDLKIQAL